MIILIVVEISLLSVAPVSALVHVDSLVLTEPNVLIAINEKVTVMSLMKLLCVF